MMLTGMIPDNGNFTDPHNHYTLTGKEYDENTGLLWFGARHYDPGVGGWMGQDLYRGVINIPMSLHRYGYVSSNPINFIDLWGFDTYMVSRQLGMFGGEDIEEDARPHEDLLVHTYVAITDSSGKVIHTYSWGNTGDKMKGWYSDVDKTVAQASIDKGFALHVGGISLDPYVINAYENVFKNQPKHKWELDNNCRDEAGRLVIEAQKNLLRDLQERNESLRKEIESIFNCMPDAMLYPNEPGYIDPYANFA